jgi:hypothetical protein
VYEADDVVALGDDIGPGPEDIKGPPTLLLPSPLSSSAEDRNGGN